MIKFVKLECPSCGGKLTKKKGKNYHCAYCNSDYLMDMDIIVPVGNKSAVPADPYQKTPSKYVDGNRATKLQLILALAFVGSIVIFAFIMALINGGFKTGTNKLPNGNNKPGYTASANNSSKTVSSNYFKAFVAAVFGKDASEVTAEELAQITYFVPRSNTYIIDYKLNHGELMTVTIEKATVSENDLKFFTGLETVRFRSQPTASTLASLPNLKDIRCNCSPNAILPNLVSPGILTSLTCYISDDKAIDLSLCPNLTYLNMKIGSNYRPNLDSLKALTKLVSLKLDMSEGYASLPFLSSMTSLRALEVKSKDLRDLSALKDLKHFEALTLVNCPISNLDFLEGKDMKVLRLADCDQLTSYEIVGTMTSLTDLMMTYNKNATYPETYKALTNVKALRLKEFPSVSFLKDFTSPTYLEMHDCSLRDFGMIVQMKELTSLRIGAFSSLVSTNINFSDLKSLPKLESFHMASMSSYGNIEELFAVPTIKSIVLDYSYISIDLNLLMENKSLEVLSLNCAKFKGAKEPTDGENATADRKYQFPWDERFDLCDYIDVLTLFPNLKELSLQDQKIESLEFTKSFPNLEFLDLTKNCVTSLDALKGLQKLKEVRCGKNSLSADASLGANVIVDKTTDVSITDPYTFWYATWE